MTATRTSAQVATGTGSPLELIQLPGGSSIYVPSVVLRAIRSSDGEIGDLKINDAGELSSFSPDTITTGSITNGTPSTTDRVEHTSPGGDSNVAIDVRGDLVGTMIFERSVDGVNWSTVSAFIAGTATTTSNAVVGNAYHGNIASAAKFRVRCTAYTSGTATVTIRSGAGTGTTTVSNPIRQGLSTLDTTTVNPWITQDQRLPVALENGRLPVAPIAAPLPDLLASKDLTSTTVTGVVGAQGTGELIVPIPAGYNTFSVRKYAGSGTLQFESSFTGAIWDSIAMTRADAQQAAAVAGSVTTTFDTWVGDIPAGTQFVRARASVVATSVSVRIGLSAAAFDPSPSVYVGGGTVGIAAGTASIGSLTGSSLVIGSVRKTGIWYDESSTIPAANGVITGAARDSFAQVTGTAAAGSGNDQFRAMAIYDQPGTLYVEVSKDGSTNWRRVAKSVAAQVDSGSGLYVAALRFDATIRFHRAVWVNGATVPTIAQLLTALIA